MDESQLPTEVAKREWTDKLGPLGALIYNLGYMLGPAREMRILHDEQYRQHAYDQQQQQQAQARTIQFLNALHGGLGGGQQAAMTPSLLPSQPSTPAVQVAPIQASPVPSVPAPTAPMATPMGAGPWQGEYGQPPSPSPYTALGSLMGNYLTDYQNEAAPTADTVRSAPAAASRVAPVAQAAPARTGLLPEGVTADYDPQTGNMRFHLGTGRTPSFRERGEQAFYDAYTRFTEQLTGQGLEPAAAQTQAARLAAQEARYVPEGFRAMVNSDAMAAVSRRRAEETARGKEEARLDYPPAGNEAWVNPDTGDRYPGGQMTRRQLRELGAVTVPQKTADALIEIRGVEDMLHHAQSLATVLFPTDDASLVNKNGIAYQAALKTNNAGGLLPPQTYQALVQYDSLLSRIGQLARSLASEKGVLTEGDVARAFRQLPSWFASRTDAGGRFKTAFDTLADRRRAQIGLPAKKPDTAPPGPKDGMDYWKQLQGE